MIRTFETFKENKLFLEHVIFFIAKYNIQSSIEMFFILITEQSIQISLIHDIHDRTIQTNELHLHYIIFHEADLT